MFIVLCGAAGYSDDQPVVESIKIFGNDNFSSARLKLLMGTKKSRFYKERRFYNDILIRDIKDIIDFYFLHGFQDVKFKDLQIHWTKDSSEVAIEIYLEEGSPVVIDSIQMKGVERLPLEDVNRNLFFRTGDRLDAEVLDASTEALTRYYANEGYLDVRVSRIIDQTEKSAVVVFEISEGTEYYFNELQIRGNTMTHTWIVEKALRLKKGDAITLKHIESYQRSLINQGLYSSVKVSTEHLATDSLVNIIVDVVEKEPGELSMGGGFGSEERARTAVQISHINISGRAAALSLEGKLSERDRNASMQHYAPYILNSRLFARAKVSYLFRVDPDFDREKIEAAGSIGHYFSEWVRIAGSYKFRRTTLLNLPADLQDIYSGEHFNLYGAELTADFRDNQIYTRRGSYFSLSGAVSNPKGFMNADFLKGNFDFRGYRDFGMRMVAAVQVKTGSLLKMDLDTTPLEERFFLGGTNSLRGYDRNSLGPQTTLGTPQGGNFYYLVRCELRADIYLPVFLKLFVDNGGLYSSVAASRIDGTYTGAGAGIGALWGVWSARLEYAWRVDGTMKPGRFHFQVGQAF